MIEPHIQTLHLRDDGEAIIGMPDYLSWEEKGCKRLWFEFKGGIVRLRRDQWTEIGCQRVFFRTLLTLYGLNGSLFEKILWMGIPTRILSLRLRTIRFQKHPDFHCDERRSWWSNSYD
jgi:hypothetical protein